MNHIFITGTGSGLGKAMAEVLLEQGHTVYGISRQESIEHANYRHQALDLSIVQQVMDYQFEIPDKAGKVVLINNAGLLGDVRHIGDLDNQSIVDTYTVNTIAPTILSNNFIRTFKDFEAEKLIINLSSGAAQSPYDGWSVYCSSKAALEMLTKVGDQEQQLDKLAYPFRFLSIAPGVVDTGMQDKVRQSNQTGFSRLQKFMDLKSEGRLYKPHDVAMEFAKIIDNPSTIPGIIHRVSL